MDGGVKVFIVMMSLMLAALDWVMYKGWRLRVMRLYEILSITIVAHLVYAILFLDLVGKI